MAELNVEALLAEIENLRAELKAAKKYGLTWDKESNPEEVVLQCEKSIPILVSEPGLSIRGEGTNNVLIEGDNFHSLTCLKMAIQDAVDVIYIDPPYNTGNKDFLYNDRYINDDDGYRHSKWLNFMCRRLKLARDLLKPDGVLMMSIDNNEMAQLKLLTDSIFGEYAYVTTIHVELSATQGMKVKAAQAGNVVKNAEYVLVYSKDGHKNIAKNLLYDSRPVYDSHYTNVLTKDGYTTLVKAYGKKLTGGIVESYSLDSSFRNWVDAHVDSIFRFDKTTGFNCDDFEEGVIYKDFKKNGRSYWLYRNGQQVNQLMFLKDSYGQCDDFKETFGLRKIRGDWWKDFYLDMGNVSKEGDVVFENGKKPVRLIEQLLKMTTDKHSLVLDFFAGSGTTGHAVLKLNRADGGDRRFILCTNNENGICENLTRQRLQNVIRGTKSDGTPRGEGLPGSVHYFKTAFLPDLPNSEQAKYNLVEQVDSLLCIAEDVFELAQRNGYSSHYVNGNRHLFIYNDYFNEDRFTAFKKGVLETAGEKIVYVYSSDNTVDETLFDDQSITVKPIPSKIYEIYKEIVEEIKRGE